MIHVNVYWWINVILPISSQVKGTAVGFMSVCSTVDVELLSRCFDLKPFNGLQKLRGLTQPRGTFAPVKVPSSVT